MRLIEKQKIFSCLLSALIQQAIKLGYEVTMGECWRPNAMANLYAASGKGIKNSQHCKRLAVDLNLFRNGIYLTRSDDYGILGKWWKEQSHDEITCRWGGDFRRKDGNHFEIK